MILLEHKSEERPYFEQIYDDGTTCDLTDKSRIARVWVLLRYVPVTVIVR